MIIYLYTEINGQLVFQTFYIYKRTMYIYTTCKLTLVKWLVWL